MQDRRKTLEVDVLVIGGGVAGMWLLDALRRDGYAALLVEAYALGAGQTICAQGIIHGGLKYTLSGWLTSAAKNVRNMPRLWRECLSGARDPDLRATRVLSDHCYLWRTEDLMSRAGLLGAAHQLASSVHCVAADQRPPALRDCPGDVFAVDEPVIDVGSLLRTLADRNAGAVLYVAGPDQMSFECPEPGRVRCVGLRHPAGGPEAKIHPHHVVLTAGAGNETLRQKLGRNDAAMQRRPLHQLMLRGPLPMLFGHCIDGARTRVTITSAVDDLQRTIWHVGGQLAEDGVRWPRDRLIEYAQQELRTILPGVDFGDMEWAAYRVDRAEQRTRNGRAGLPLRRPSQPGVLVEGNVLTAWPTKLAMAPVLAQRIEELLERPRIGAAGFEGLPGWPAPQVAPFPWETCTSWRGPASP